MTAVTAQNLLEGNILEMLGLQSLPEKRKTELLTRMTEVVQDRISDRMAESLSADARKEFDQLIADSATGEQLDAFIAKHVPEFPQIVAEEVMRFKKQMVDDLATVQKIVTTS